MPAPANNPIELAEPTGGARFTHPGGSRPLDGFTIKRGIGRGGFGEVYYAVSDAGKEVALKLVRRNLDVEVRGVTQCLNLKHVNLIALYDIKRDAQDDAWVVMEYVSGESLEDVLQRTPGGMSPTDVQRWLRGMFAAVAYLHDHGIVHRDLKPGNVFSDEGVVKIGDYGLSKYISCSRRSGQTESVGTVHYMAPEIANGRYGKEIDIYALGVIVYEMLSGRVPFEGESLGEVLMKHLTAEPDVSNLAEPYRTAVRRALAKDPAQRPASIDEFARLLRIPMEIGSHATGPNATAEIDPPVSPDGRTPLAPPIPPSPAGPSGAPSVEVQLAQAMIHANIIAQQRFEREEPIWRAIKDAGRQMSDSWRDSNLGVFAKLVILVPCLILAVVTFEIWAVALLVGGVIYAMYRGIRAIVLSGKRPPPIPPTPNANPFDIQPNTISPSSPHPNPTHVPHHGPPPPPVAQPTNVSRSDRWRASAANALATKTTRAKIRELTGSMLVAAVLSIAGSVVMIALRGEDSEPHQYAWLAIMCTLASWAVLIPAKFWEAGEGEPLLRRIAMFVMGMFVGVAAWFLYGAFQASPNSVVLPWDHLQAGHPAWADKLHTTTGLPTRMSFVVFFALLFALPAWWRLANPLRLYRLGIWATVKPILWAFAVNYFWPCPYPWGVLVAASTAIAVQVSSVWLSPETRHQRPNVRGEGAS